MNTIIRRANKNDINRILDLLGQVLNIHVKLRPDVFRDNTTKYRQEELIPMVEDNNNPIYVICDNNEVLGYAFCQIRIPRAAHLLKRNKTFYIDDFCIDEKARRQHLGQTLFDYLKQEARRLNCEEMTLNCWVDNKAANEFYKKMGFKARSEIMEFIVK